MEKLFAYLKKTNLLFTDTIDREEFFDEKLVLDNENIDTTNSISLYNLLASFNKLYLLFKKEYTQLENLGIGEEFYFNEYQNFQSDGDNYRVLVLYVTGQDIVDDPYALLYLREINGEIKPFICDRMHNYRQNIELDENISKEYLDLFAKYGTLINAYNTLRRCQPYGDGINCMFIAIEDKNDDLLTEIKKFDISFGCTSASMQYYISLIIKMGEEFGIDYGNSIVKLNGIDQPIDKSQYDEIFKDTYLNKKYLKHM